jgi:hypothetical protein
VILSTLRYAISIHLIMLLAVTNADAQRPDTSLTLTNQDGVARKLSIAQLRAMPQVELKLQETDGSPMVVRGPSLRAVLSVGGAPTGQMLRGPSMLLVVIAEGSDGYKVAYTLSELDEQFGARDGIIALSQNGKTLPDADGPMRVVIGTESHRARWVRHLDALRVVRVGSAPPPSGQ